MALFNAQHTVIQEIFVFEKFWVINYCVKYFRGLWQPQNISTQNLVTYAERMEEYERDLYVCGFNVNHDTWEAADGEVLDCKKGPGNTKDRHAVAVKKEATVIGHLPKKTSRVCSLFLRRGGSIQCTVTARQ